MFKFFTKQLEKKKLSLQFWWYISNPQPNKPSSIRLPKVWCSNHMQSHFSHNKVRYLIPICNFGHKFTELHYFNKTFNFGDTKYFLMYSGSYHMKFLLIEIGLQFFIRP